MISTICPTGKVWARLPANPECGAGNGKSTSTEGGSGRYGASSAHPFVVIVDPKAVPMPEIRSIGHRRDFKDIEKHTVIWKATDEEA
jgi:hypothetical protein